MTVGKIPLTPFRKGGFLEKPPVLSLRAKRIPAVAGPRPATLCSRLKAHLLLAMTKIEQNGGCAKLSVRKTAFLLIFGQQS